MKTKRFLSMVIAAAMAMQCAAFSVFAENTDTVTVVANDIDTDWTMQWNWERYEQGFDYFCDWTLTDGFSLTHNAGLHKELSDVDYALTQDENKAYTVYNETFPSSGEYKVAFRTNEAGKAVAYNAEDATSTENLWYHQGRSNVIAKFDVGETENNGKPIVVSFKYQSTNPATGAWVNGPATSFLLYGVGGKAIFNLYNNDSGRGFTIAGSQTKNITSEWDYKAEHTVKLVISPELTSDGRYQMTAIELDGVVTKFEDMYSSSSGLKDVLLNKICYSSRGDSGKDYTDQISNLTVVRGIEQIDVTSSVADGAKDVIPQNIELNFTDTVSLADGAVKVYENGTELAASDYTVTMSEDAKTAVLSIPNYKSLTAYKLVLDKALVKGSIGGELKEGLDINFVTTKNVTMIANDIDTDWVIGWNAGRYEDGMSYHTTYSVTDGLKFTNDGTVYKQIDAVDIPVTVEWGTGAITDTTQGSCRAFATDSDGNIVVYDAQDTTQTLHPWMYSGYNNINSTFTAGEKANNGQPVTVEFDYKTKNAGNEVYMASMLSFLGFSIYPNFQGTKVSSATGVGLNNNPDSTNYRQDVVAKIPVGENTEADGWHSVKCVISPKLAENGQCEMTAIEVDGVVTPLEGIYGSALDSDDKIIVNKITARFRADGTDRSLELKNLKVYRSDENVSISSSVANGATEVIPTNIEVNFTSQVSLSDGAVKVYENGVEMAAENYTVTLSDDALKAYVSIPEYKSRTAYKLVVDKTLVSGIYGGNVENGLEINFVSAKKVENLEGSDSNLAAGYTIAGAGYGGVGQKFTTVETDADGVTTITIDNDTWAKAESANSDKTGDAAWEYDINGDGTPEKLGHGTWTFSNVVFNNISDIKKSTEPIVISMDYSFENAGSEANNIWVTMGDKGTNMFMLTPFGEKPNVSGSSWDGTNYASGVTETDWHSVQYVIDPTLDENSKTSISQITLDDEVIKDTAGNWVSYGTSPAENEANGQYIKGMNMRLWLVKGAKDENGAYLPTVLKIKNFKVLRAKKLTAVIDTDALTSADNILNVRFSDPVSEGELANLKVMKGANIVENAISAASISEDGMSAKLTVNLDVTARYNLVISEVSDIYGVKPSTASIAFEYYNTTDGYVTIADSGVADDGTNTTVSFTFTGSKTVSPLVIAAAYDKNMSLIGINTKIINLTPSAYISDSITLEKVSGAARIQLMAWDSLESMKPYCIARDFE